MSRYLSILSFAAAIMLAGPVVAQDATNALSPADEQAAQEAEALGRAMSEPLPTVGTKAPVSSNVDTTAQDDDDKQFVVSRSAQSSMIITNSVMSMLRGQLRGQLKVNFVKASPQLTAGAMVVLDRYIIGLLKNSAPARLSVEGHTDKSGSAAFNLKLSRERAASVRDYLLGHGLADTRIIATGFGFRKTITGLMPDDPRNRRVEIAR